MATSFLPYEPNQAVFFPPSPCEWLPEDHLAYFIADTVASLSLQDFYARYEGDGRRNQPFHPAMMLKVLIYAYATGTFSSRKIARKLYEDVAFRYLSCNNFPAFRTIAEFRQVHLLAFNSLFVQVVRIAKEAGLVNLGTLAIDGTKVKANASRHSAMSYGRMLQEEKRLREEIAGLAQKATTLDQQEDQAFGVEQTGMVIPDELRRRESRLKTIEAAHRRLEARQAAEDIDNGREPGDHLNGEGKGQPPKRPFGVPEDKKQENFTDPQSRIMKTSGGFDQCFNAQLAVDELAQIIVGTVLTNSPVDVRLLVPVLDEVVANCGNSPLQVLVDAGYKSEANNLALEARKIEGFVAQGRGEKKAKATPNSDRPANCRMAEKMSTHRGQTIYRRRKSIVEPVNGWIKACLGFRAFSLRGLN